MGTDLVVSGFMVYDDKVLLVHYEGLDLWLPPLGKIRDEETPDDALKRNFEEESGVEVHPLTIPEVPDVDNIQEHLATPFYVNVHTFKGKNRCCLYYLCVPDDPKDIEEGDDYRLFSRERLKKEHVPEDVRHIASLALNEYEEFEP